MRQLLQTPSLLFLALACWPPLISAEVETAAGSPAALHTSTATEHAMAASIDHDTDQNNDHPDAPIASPAMDSQIEAAVNPDNTIEKIASMPPRPGKLELITLNNIDFDHDQAILTRRSKKTLDDSAEYLLNNSMVSRVIIDGHANSIDNMNYNYRLSDKRAYAVKDYLVMRGVPPDLLHIRGWGETYPIDENWTRAGRARNRRVELYVIQNTPSL